MSENVVDFAPPGLNDAPAPKEDIPKKDTLTRGERLVDLTFNPSGDVAVRRAKVRGAETVDELGNLPLNVLKKLSPDGSQVLQTFDAEHKLIIEEAIRRQIDATMWAVKALTWGK